MIEPCNSFLKLTLEAGGCSDHLRCKIQLVAPTEAI